MDNEKFEIIENEIKKYVLDNLPLNELGDDELYEKIEGIVSNRFKGEYVSIDKKVEITESVYSSIRGFGFLDNIIRDDNITEVMINGKNNIFIEEKGVTHRIDQTFESDRRLEDIIQRIVGLAGREVNQANPICDTRLPDGSRVNVVLPPIALCGPTVTIRKFSKTPMTIDQLIKYANLKRPMIFYMYDLEHYQNESNGFYIDVKKELPGKIVSDDEELVNGIISVSDEFVYDEKYLRFNEKYNYLDDGKSTERVVEKIFFES